MLKKPECIDLCVTFDTTGSMYPCLTQVRRSIEQMLKALFGDIPKLRVALIAHGDYCDEGNPYVTKVFDFSNDPFAICENIRTIKPTNGGDSPECYELVLNQARSLNWQAGRAKVLVLIGDDVPHEPGYRYGRHHVTLNWRNEVKLLHESGIAVQGVHCMPGIRGHSRRFYQEVAKGGSYLTLDQFSDAQDLIMAIAYKEQGLDALHGFQDQVQKRRGRLTRNMRSVFSTLGSTRVEAAWEVADGLVPVPTGRFQIMEVTEPDPRSETKKISTFVRDQGIEFKTGRGFYQFTKKETIQQNKEVVLVHKGSGDIFTGPAVRDMLGLPEQGGSRGSTAGRIDVKLDPFGHPDYLFFVQSTSSNRGLVPGTQFLYEVSDWDRSAS